ncbi:hypothetical protein [Natronobacterium texcoconense]|uniref:DUF8130 domain-containing protein n=1 Tax=Natronobacterium texcoconense TaxID=1095778 RepID=A0A1H1ICY3_NATTX|nr:hypothetical protein [Natronobacterium texcoconense]SDR35429.1 hypothetical protein SAMN04489842_3433 [Natronobacterium texcoconense]
MNGDDPSRGPSIRRRTLLGVVAGSTTALAGCMADSEYEIGAVETHSSPDELLSFDLDVLDPEIRVDSPGVIELTTENDGDEQLEIASRGVRPYGILELRGEPEGYPGEARIRLWSDEYEESDHVDVRPSGMGLDGEELIMTLSPGETTSFAYEIHGDDIGPTGTYELAAGLGNEDIVTYRRPDGTNDEETGTGESENEENEEDGSRVAGTGVTPRIEVTVDSRSRIPFR